jgi:UDP-N-acetylmuramyl pentapeptide synthase
MKIVKIPRRFVTDTLKTLKLPDRRSTLKAINGYQVIDDSYSISLQTAKIKIEDLKKYKDKLVLVTAGIPESGLNPAKINFEYGKFLKNKVDHLIVYKSIFHKNIIDGYERENVLVLIQPELTDLYY